MNKAFCLVLALLLTGCVTTGDGNGTVARIVGKYCALSESARLSLRYAIDHDLICIAGYVAPPGAGSVVRLYCATYYARPAIKDLVARDVCGVGAGGEALRQQGAAVRELLKSWRSTPEINVDV